jgi:phage terminase small subunit
METTKLTNDEKLFVKEYLSNGFNQTKAYLKIFPNTTYGVAATLSSKLLKKNHIKSFIEKEIEKAGEKMDLRKEDLIKDLLKIKEMCVSEDKRSIHNAIKAIEVLNKMLGYNAPEKTDVNIQGDIDISKLIDFGE